MNLTLDRHNKADFHSYSGAYQVITCTKIHRHIKLMIYTHKFHTPRKICTDVTDTSGLVIRKLLLNFVCGLDTRAKTLLQNFMKVLGDLERKHFPSTPTGKRSKQIDQLK